MTLLTRRRLLAALGIGLVSAPGLGLLAGAPPTADQARRLAGLFTRPADAARVGAAYRREVPKERRLAVLVERVVAGLPGGAVTVLLRDDATLRGAVARQCHDDLVAGRVVVVDGWILAVTEARMCAVADAVGRAEAAGVL